MLKKLIINRRWLCEKGIILCFLFIGCGGGSPVQSEKLDSLLPQKTKKPTIKVLHGYQDITRSFFYFSVPKKISHFLLNIRDKLKQDLTINNNIHWCEVPYFHITIAFPKDITALQSNQISTDLENLLKNQQPIKMELELVPIVWSKVIVCLVKNSPELTSFQKAISLVIKKYVPDFDLPATYLPHITLGYFKNHVSSEFKADLTNKLPKLIKTLGKEKYSWFTDQFELGHTASARKALKSFIVYSF